MLLEFSIENFRSVKDKITLSMEATGEKSLEEHYVIKEGKNRILKTALLFGPNASGKSNIVEGMKFLRRIVLRHSPFSFPYSRYKKFAFDTKTEKLPTVLKAVFIEENIKYNYTVFITYDKILKEKLYFFQPKKALVFERSTNEDDTVSVKFGSKIKLKKIDKELLTKSTLPAMSLLHTYTHYNIKTEHLENVKKWFTEKLTIIDTKYPFIDSIVLRKLGKNKSIENVFLKQLAKADFTISGIEKEEEEIDLTAIMTAQNKNPKLERIREIFPGILTQLVFEEGQNEGREEFPFLKKEKNKLLLLTYYAVHKINNRNFKLEINDESDGTKRFMTMLYYLLEAVKKEKIILIDEIATHLHPELISHLYLLFLLNSKRAQMVATTHFRELLLEKDILRPDVIWFVEKKQDGSTDLYSLADFSTAYFRKENSYYNFYKAGRFGATPKIVNTPILWQENGETEN